MIPEDKIAASEPIEDIDISSVTKDPFDVFPDEAGPLPVADEIVPGADPQHAPEQPPLEGSETGLVDPPSQPAPDQAPIAVIEAESAFVVYLQNGHWVANGDMTATVKTIRPATIFDFGHAATDIAKDLQANANAQATLQLMMQQQAMAQQAQVQAEIVKRTGMNPGGAVDLSQLNRR
jgi:hypothetical protein